MHAAIKQTNQKVLILSGVGYPTENRIAALNNVWLAMFGVVVEYGSSVLFLNQYQNCFSEVFLNLKCI